MRCNHIYNNIYLIYNGIIYDKSEYIVKVEVTKGASDNLNIVSTVTKVKDLRIKQLKLNIEQE